MDTAAYRESIVRAVYISLRGRTLERVLCPACASDPHGSAFLTDRAIRRFCVYLGLRERRILRREQHPRAMARKRERRSAALLGPLWCPRPGGLR